MKPWRRGRRFVSIRSTVYCCNPCRRETGHKLLFSRQAEQAKFSCGEFQLPAKFQLQVSLSCRRSEEAEVEVQVRVQVRAAAAE